MHRLDLGGVVQSGVAARLERRREGWAARKAARLFIPRLMRFVMAQGEARSDSWTWADLCDVVAANLNDWDEFADVFAGTLEYEDWSTIYGAVRPMQQMVLGAPDNADQRTVRPPDEDYLDALVEKALGACAVLTHVAFDGVHKHRIRSTFNRVRYRLFPFDDDAMLRELGIDPDELEDDDDDTDGSLASR